MAGSEAERAEMRLLTLQPWPSTPIPDGLSGDQKLAYAAFNIKKHIGETKDKIRLNALCEAYYSDPDASFKLFPQGHRTGPPHTEFRQAARSIWNPGSPIPTVKTSSKTQPVFHIQEGNSRVAIAKKLLARLNEYDEATKPLLDALNLAKEGRASGFITRDTTSRVGKRKAENDEDDERSRDPRLIGRRA